MGYRAALDDTFVNLQGLEQGSGIDGDLSSTRYKQVQVVKARQKPCLAETDDRKIGSRVAMEQGFRWMVLGGLSAANCYY